MRKTAVVLAVLGVALAVTIFADEDRIPDGIPRLDHVFVVMMENHSYGQILSNPNAPFANQLARSANLATNYFAVAHPSLTNYLEVVGGSNFGVQSDNNPDWHNLRCQPNIVLGTVNTDNPTSSDICPIWGYGKDAATPRFDTTNETVPPTITSVTNIDGVQPAIPPARTVGKTIADQLAEHDMSWKSYQESLSPGGANGVNFADGFFTDGTNIPGVLLGEAQSLIKLYAAKHNPFVYFRSIQEGENPRSGLKNVAGFEGARGLFEDLASGRMPEFSFIVPNQCNDQHVRDNAGPACDFDPNDNGTQAGLNPALIYTGDLALRNIVNAIHNSPVWQDGRNAIVVLWDENDYSATPNTNHVMTIVDTNYGSHGTQSGRFYTHFSLLKTVEAGFGLPCLNHACDASVHVMDDLFQERR
jgi:phosphatidylinositol-3-phosphatase